MPGYLCECGRRTTIAEEHRDAHELSLAHRVRMSAIRDRARDYVLVDTVHVLVRRVVPQLVGRRLTGRDTDGSDMWSATCPRWVKRIAGLVRIDTTTRAWAIGALLDRPELREPFGAVLEMHLFLAGAGRYGDDDDVRRLVHALAVGRWLPP